MGGRNVWLLAGQSNMEGCAPLAGAQPPDPRVWCFTCGERWQMAEEPLHHAGIGPGLAFGIAMAQATGQQIGLVPTAVGGTSLTQWGPGGGADSLYGRMLDRARRAGGRLRGLLWYQGEADAGSPGAAATYGVRLEAWIAAVRADLGVPDLPVIIVQIARRAMGTQATAALHAGWDAVRDAQLTLPARVPMTAVVGSVDLGLTDTVHLDAPAQHRLGRRLARAAQRVATMPGPRCTPCIARIVPCDITGLGGLRLVCDGVTGAWHPAHHLAGFGVYTADGRPHPDCWVIDASRDPDDGTAIRLILNRPADDTASVGYARGADPYGNAVDDADLPLPACLLPVLKKR